MKNAQTPGTLTRRRRNSRFRMGSFYLREKNMIVNRVFEFIVIFVPDHVYFPPRGG